MNYRTTARRLEALEAHAAEEAAARYDALLRSLSDDELDAYVAATGGFSEEVEALSDADLERLAADARPTYDDYQQLHAWLEDRRASLT